MKEINMKAGRMGWFFLILASAIWLAAPATAVAAVGAENAAAQASLFITPQEEEEPDAAPTVAEICKKLDKLYRDKRNLDSDAIMALIQIGDESFKTASSSEQGKLAKTIRKVFDIKPLPDDAVLKAAAGALSGMGKKGKDALFHALKSKNLKPKSKSDEVDYSHKIGLQAFIVEAIGFNKEQSSVKELSKLLWNDDTPIVIAAAKALSNYSTLELKERKPIVEELVKVYANIDALSLANPKREDYRQRLLQIEVPFNEALRALTLKSFESAEEWQKWYNDNKSKPKW
jgi:hypothetical protein